MEQTKINRKIPGVFLLWVGLAVQVIVTLAWPFVGTVHAYTCTGGTYWDGTVCRTYAKVTTGATDGSGHLICPTGAHNFTDSSGTCWGPGEKSSIIPTRDDGTPINQQQDVNCGTYHSLGDGDFNTYYYADRNSCCGHLGWPFSNTINKFACVDPSLKDDPSTKTVKQCTDAGAQFDTSSHQCKWTEDSCKKAGGQWNAGSKGCDNLPNPDQQNQGPAAGPTGPGNPTSNVQGFNTPGNCGQAKTNIIKNCGNGKGLPILGQVLKFGLGALTMIVGVAAVGGLAWASVLYAKGQDNEGNTKEAKDLIRNVVIGIVLFGFLIAISNWLLPGGPIS